MAVRGSVGEESTFPGRGRGLEVKVAGSLCKDVDDLGHFLGEGILDF